ncbi:hypothetical protein [Paracoccus sp. (in: a-proteobacteria)]|uniref:hypothetical protein n=1 Tax=Paracoccus sp. TaxID=267 RepID=UPI0035AF8605
MNLTRILLQAPHVMPDRPAAGSGLRRDRADPRRRGGAGTARAICDASRGGKPGLRMALSTDGPASDALQREWRSRFGTGLDPAP